MQSHTWPKMVELNLILANCTDSWQSLTLFTVYGSHTILSLCWRQESSLVFHQINAYQKFHSGRTWKLTLETILPLTMATFYTLSWSSLLLTKAICTQADQLACTNTGCQKGLSQMNMFWLSNTCQNTTENTIAETCSSKGNQDITHQQSLPKTIHSINTDLLT